MTRPGEFDALGVDGKRTPDIAPSLRELTKPREPEQADNAAQVIEDQQSMVESTTDRRILAEIDSMPKQPQATHFTEIVASVTKDGEYAVRVLLDSGQHIIVSHWVCREEAQRLELAINQVMIEYRTKRNAWEIEKAHDRRD